MTEPRAETAERRALHELLGLVRDMKHDLEPEDWDRDFGEFWDEAIEHAEEETR